MTDDRNKPDSNDESVIVDLELARKLYSSTRHGISYCAHHQQFRCDCGHQQRDYQASLEKLATEIALIRAIERERIAKKFDQFSAECQKQGHNDRNFMNAEEWREAAAAVRMDCEENSLEDAKKV